MKFLAWVVLICNILNVILMPPLFGKPRQPYSYNWWLVCIAGSVLQTLLVGRVLGWW